MEADAVSYFDWLRRRGTSQADINLLRAQREREERQRLRLRNAAARESTASVPAPSQPDTPDLSPHEATAPTEKVAAQDAAIAAARADRLQGKARPQTCLLYTSPSPRD